MNTATLPHPARRVLVFSRSFSLEQAPLVQLETVRQQVAATGMQLVVVSSAGIFVFEPDGRIARVDRIVGDITTAMVVYRVRQDDAAFFLDAGRTQRLAYDGTLEGALATVAQRAAA